MLEELKKDIEKLIALYEAEKDRSESLRQQLVQAQERNVACGKQISELENEIDNLKLTEAFMAPAGSDSGARKKIDNLIREIDKCISLLES